MKTYISALLLFASLSAHAGNTIIGGPTCGDWIKERRENGWGSVVNASWLMGYVSGLNLGSKVDLLAKTDSESMQLYVDKHCRENPLDRVYVAAGMLIYELRFK